MSASRLMTPEEVAERLGVEVTTAKTYLRSGKIPGAVKLGERGLLRLPENAFEEFVTGLPLVRPRPSESEP